MAKKQIELRKKLLEKIATMISYQYYDPKRGYEYEFCCKTATRIIRMFDKKKK